MYFTTVVKTLVNKLAGLLRYYGESQVQTFLSKTRGFYKKGSKLDPGNYWPISILCALSKVIEKIIYEQIYIYFLK